MLPTRKGGAVMRNASRLALLALLLWLTPGCRKSAPTILSTRQYVRLDALLPLHPAWAQVQALDAAQARFPSAQIQASALKYPLTPLPEVFAPPVTVPPSLANEREKRVKEDALHYVQQTEQALTAKNGDIVKRLERDEQRQTEARFGRARADLELKLSLANEEEANLLESRINVLGFRLVALRTQIDAYTKRLSQDPRNPVVKDAVRQAATVSGQMNALDEQHRLVLLRDVQATAVEQLAATHRQWLAESVARMQSRRAELSASVRQQVEQARARLNNDIKPIPPLANTSVPPVDPRATPLPLPIGPDAPHAIGQAQAQLGVAMAQEKQAWLAQREALVAAIRADTAQAVTQIARKEGWNLVSAGHVGTDVTAQAAGAVRAQWRQNAVSEP